VNEDYSWFFSRLSEDLEYSRTGPESAVYIIESMIMFIDKTSNPRPGCEAAWELLAIQNRAQELIHMIKESHKAAPPFEQPLTKFNPLQGVL